MNFEDLIFQIKSLIKSSNFKKYTSNISWLLLSKVFTFPLSLFITFYVGRYLGPQNLGILSYSESFVGIFSVFVSLGLESIVVKKLVQDKKNEGLYLGTSFWIKIIAAAIIIAIIGIIVFLSDNSLLTKFTILILASSLIFDSFQVIVYYFESIVKSKYTVIARNISLIIIILTKLLLIYFKASVLWFASMILLNNIITAICLIYYYSKISGKLSQWKFKTKTMISYFKESWPLLLSGIVATIYMKIDQIMIKEMLTEKAVGFYAAALYISQLWYIVIMAIATSLFPLIIEAKEKGKEFSDKVMSYIFSFMFWSAFLVALLLMIFAKKIIILTYGDGYLASAAVLAIHTWVGVLIALGVMRNKWVITENLQHLEFICLLFGAIVNVILNYLLIPKFGIIGAASTSLIAQFVANLVLPIFIKKLRGVTLLQYKSIFLFWLFKSS